MPDMGSVIGTLLVVVVILFVIFLVIREVMCWYWKINRIVVLLESIDKKLFANSTSSANSIVQNEDPTLSTTPKTSGTGSIYEAWKTEKLLKDIKSIDFTDAAKSIMRKELMDRFKITFDINKYECCGNKFDVLQQAVIFAMSLA